MMVEPGYMIRKIKGIYEVPGRGTILTAWLQRTACWTGPEALIDRNVIYEGNLYVITGVEHSGSSSEVGLQVRGVGSVDTFLQGKVPARELDELKTGRWPMDQPNISNGPRPDHDYAELGVRVIAMAIEEMGLGEWYHELMEIVCFPDVDDIDYIRDQIKEHLNDERVAFLRAEATGGRDESEAQTDDDR